MSKSNLVAEQSHRGHPGVLVLCEPHDESAMWVTAGLEERTARPVDVVTGPMLAGARTWEHRIRGDVAEVEITLEDGRRISSTRPRPVLNRLSFVWTHPLTPVASADRDYAMQEFHALFLSWLWAYPGPMLNRPLRSSSGATGAIPRHGPCWPPRRASRRAATGRPVMIGRRARASPLRPAGARPRRSSLSPARCWLPRRSLRRWQMRASGWRR